MPSRGPLPKIRGRLFCDGLLTNGSGDTCRQPAGHGTNHVGWGYCKKHGGCTQTHVAAAQYAQAAATARVFAVPREVHPIDGMMECYWRTAGLVDAMEAICSQLMPDEMVWGLIEEKTVGSDGDGGEGLTPPERKYGAGVSTWIKLFGAERDRMFREGEAILKLDLASRQVELAQTQVAALVQVLLSPDLGLSQDQLRVAARLLRGLERAAPAIEAA